MPYQDLKLVTKLAQKQVLTPGLVQMVSLLTLNKLELTEMIQQELVQNPVLEEGTEIVENSAPEIEMGQESPEQAVEIDGSDAEYQACVAQRNEPDELDAGPTNSNRWTHRGGCH